MKKVKWVLSYPCVESPYFMIIKKFGREYNFYYYKVCSDDRKYARKLNRSEENEIDLSEEKDKSFRKIKRLKYLTVYNESKPYAKNTYLLCEGEEEEEIKVFCEFDKGCEDPSKYLFSFLGFLLNGAHI